MNHQELVSHYKNKFNTDPLLRRISNEGLEDILFKDEDYFSKVTFTDTYSSKQAAEILNMIGKEQTLLNYINRNDLGSYLGVYKQERFYRYDWVSLFKFKMLLVLSKNDFAPIDIAAIIGTRVETAATIDAREYKVESRTSTSTDTDYHEIARKLAAENLNHLMATIKSYEEYKEIETSIRSEQTLLQLDLKLNGERAWSIQGRIDDLDGYLTFMQTTNASIESNQAGGMLSRLFKRKSPAQDGLVEGLSSFEEKKLKLQEALETTKTDEQEILLKIDESQKKIDTLKQLSLKNHFQFSEIENNERVMNDVLTSEFNEAD